MVETKYENIPNPLLVNYFKFLVGRIFKILPLKENEPHALNDYLESLQRELSGSRELIKSIRYDGDFLKLMSKIQFIISENPSHKILRKEVFECINIIQKLQKNYEF